MWREDQHRVANVERRSLALVPVETTPVLAAAIAVVTPTGYRVEGLALEQIARLLRELA